MEVHYASIRELCRLIRDKAISPVEILETCLERIHDLNPRVNAFITVTTDEATEQAREADSEIRAGRWRGPLHGIPVAVKDFYDTAGTRTTAAFEPFEKRLPAKDAVAVNRLKTAGAVIVGKTNMHTLGMGTTGLESHFGPVRNPWSSESIPGGSSSGSAAAVASGMCYATVDTDAIGSCRLPAACCGVVGFKGTYGLIDMTGILEGEPPPDETIRWLAHAGITTRSAADTALVLDILAERNQDTYGGLTNDRRSRIGIVNNVRSDHDVSHAFQRSIDALRGLGYSMSEVAAPLPDPRDGIGKIEADRQSVADEAFKDVDILLLPTTSAVTPSVRDASGNPVALSPENTVFANYYGLPAISVPCGFDQRGLPLGLQFVGKPWNDGVVLRTAHHFLLATGHGETKPME